MKYKVLSSGCGCNALVRMPEAVDLPFITEDSDISQNANDYMPFVSEDGQLLFTPENVDDMSTPTKFSEISDAPNLNAMSYFVGYQDNGDEPGTNYKFTPAQLIAYVLTQTRKVLTPAADGDTLTDEWLATHEITEIVMNGQSYLVDEAFTQEGDTVTRISGMMGDFSTTTKAKLIQ